MTRDFKTHFQNIADFLLNELLPDEQAAIYYVAENSDFMRFNTARVRQNGSVDQAHVFIRLWKQNRSFQCMQVLHFNADDFMEIASALQLARTYILLLPEDPYYALPTANKKSQSLYAGKLLPVDNIAETILSSVKNFDFTGLYSQGTLCRGVINSVGANHWFQTENFLLDYSIWLKNGRGVKSSYSGRTWSDTAYAEKIVVDKEKLAVLEKKPKKIKPGKYRMFISPAAFVEFVDFFSWNGFSEKEMQQGSSAYIGLREGREQFSSLVTLVQDFSLGLEPAFNAEGDLAPEILPVISRGKLENTLVSTRSEKQYGVPANGANVDECMRSISLQPGTLAEADVLKELDTGIYISNFHYLNWSDVQTARITGMTRFACLWVENGNVVAPIEDMRWDESMYNILGANLVALTDTAYIFPESSTYNWRNTGGCSLPGLLVKDFNCTL